MVKKLGTLCVVSGYVSLKIVHVKRDCAEQKHPLNQKTSLPTQRHSRHPTHKVNSSEAAMADLPKVSKQLLWIIFAEEISHLWVLEIARPCTRGHGQGLEDSRHRGSLGGHRGVVWKRSG